jgi:hypothetical protein
MHLGCAAVVDGAAVAQAGEVLVGGSEGHGGNLRRAGAATGGAAAGGAAIGASVVGWVKQKLRAHNDEV